MSDKKIRKLLLKYPKASLVAAIVALGVFFIMTIGVGGVLLIIILGSLGFLFGKALDENVNLKDIPRYLLLHLRLFLDWIKSTVDRLAK